MGDVELSLKQDRDIDENSGTCRVSVSEAARYVKDTTEQVIPVAAEAPDADRQPQLCVRAREESGEQFFQSPRRARAADTESRDRS